MPKTASLMSAASAGVAGMAWGLLSSVPHGLVSNSKLVHASLSGVWLRLRLSPRAGTGLLLLDSSQVTRPAKIQGVQNTLEEWHVHKGMGEVIGDHFWRKSTTLEVSKMLRDHRWRISFVRWPLRVSVSGCGDRVGAGEGMVDSGVSRKDVIFEL